jgi:tetratricopeptide (TPR) repeat protein
VAHTNLGLALQAKGQVEEAIACFRKTIALNPKLAPAHRCLGAILCDAKRDYDGAIACFRQAIALDPKYAFAHYSLGNALHGKGKVEEAISCFRQAIALDPKYAQAHNNLGHALAGKGKVEEAIACFHKAIALNPKLVQAHSSLGQALVRQGKDEEASAAYRQAILLRPWHPETHCNLGDVLRRQGRLAESLELYRRGHALGMKRPGWPYPSADWVRDAERLVLLEKNLPAVLSGKLQPASAREILEYSRVCTLTRRHASSARLYAAAFAADGKLADDLKAGHRYHAACSAALAGCGKGQDSGQLDEQQKARLRQQACSWLAADLRLRSQQLHNGKAADRAEVQRIMLYWRSDNDLACVRDKGRLACLPQPERQQWQQLWGDVVALRQRAAVGR